jgi:hypothetical protein
VGKGRVRFILVRSAIGADGFTIGLEDGFDVP